MSVQGQSGKSLQRWSAGPTLGMNLTHLRLTDKKYDIYESRMAFHPVAGAFVQYRSEGGFSLRPEVLYYGRGGGLYYEDVSYKMLAHCLGIRLGMRVDCVVPRTLFTFYAVATPELTLTMGGSVDYSSRSTGKLEMALSSSNMNVADFGAFCGLGVEWPLFFNGKAIYLSGEVGYHLYFTNTFTTQELEGTVDVLNTANLPPAAKKQRQMGGLEMTLRVGIPFGKNVRIKRLWQWQ